MYNPSHTYLQTYFLVITKDLIRRLKYVLCIWGLYGAYKVQIHFTFEETKINDELKRMLMFLFTFVSRVPKEDPSGKSIILEPGEFQRIKVCFMIKTAYKIHIIRNINFIAQDFRICNGITRRIHFLSTWVKWYYCTIIKVSFSLMLFLFYSQPPTFLQKQKEKQL